MNHSQPSTTTMPKEKNAKSSSKQLRHAPLGTEPDKNIVQTKKNSKKVTRKPDEDTEDYVPDKLGRKIFKQARNQLDEVRLFHFFFIYSSFIWTFFRFLDV
jgi:hypothetical protein